MYLTLTATLVNAQPTAPTKTRSAVPADINKKFLDADLDAEQWAKRFEAESREIYACRKDIVKSIGLTAGDSIADVGAGTGIFLELFSNAVSDTGKVYAVEISPRFLDYLEHRIEDEGFENAQVVESKADSVALPAESVDFVFLCDTYHHFEYHADTLLSIRNALRPGGQLILIDFERIPGKTREWLLKHVRAGKEQFKKEVQQSGFRFVEEVQISGFRENYFLRFEKP
jgi:ubiquinone/menaquinone biosynthesis C-methylase UbiE